MPHTVYCSCGQAIKVPDNLTHRKARCNKCGAVIRLGGAASVETSDLEAIPAAVESRGPGEAKACGDCSKRFPFDQLYKVRGDLICMRCRVKREEARRHRIGMVFKSIVAVILLVGGGIAWVRWVGPAIAKYRESQLAAGTGKDANPKPNPEKRPPVPPLTNKDSPKDGSTTAPPTTPPMPLAPAGELADYRGAHLIAIAPVGKTIALFKRDSAQPPRHTLRVFDLQSGGELKSLEMDYNIDHMAISDDGARLMTLGRVDANAEMRMWDLAEMKVLANGSVLESFGGVGIAPDGSEGWCLCPKEGIRIIDPNGAKSALYREPHAGSVFAAFDAPNHLAAVRCSFGEADSVVQWIDVFDLHQKKLVNKIDPREPLGCLAFSPDGSLLALGFADRIALYHFTDFRWRLKTTVGRGDMKNAPRRVMITADNERVIDLPAGTDGTSPVLREIDGGRSRLLDAGVCIDWAMGPGGELYVLSEGEAVRRFDVAAIKAE